MAIPIIDIFAGPGGLVEGFCTLQDDKGERVFKIVLSIEKDKHAHETLTLRSSFWQFKPGEAPPDYYEFVKGNIELEDPYKKWPDQAASAKSEAWQAGGVSSSHPDRSFKPFAIAEGFFISKQAKCPA